uniref:SWIM-type domain-containing protein n=1 Tax=Ornithorhynchus anatinus TaxID=9258 RepID=A0A6I8NZT9_ORNAN
MGDLGLGREFHTWHQFTSFFDDWCEAHKALFIVASLKPLVSQRRHPPPYLPNLAATLRFRFVRLICRHSGTYVGQSTVQRNKLSEKIACPASVTLRLGPKKDRLVVIEANLEHNHQLAAGEFARRFRRRQLEASLGLPIRITNSVSKRFLAPDLVRNLEDYSRDKDKGMCELLAQLDGLFQADPGAKVKLVFQEDVAILGCIFLATSPMRELLRAAPRLLFLDLAAGLGGDFDLYSVLCQDADGRGREAAYCLARRGTRDLLVFIVASLVQSVPDIKARVECLTVGAALPAGADAVEDVLPRARVQICRAQVLEALGRRARELAPLRRGRLLPLLRRLARAASPGAYGRDLSRLEDAAPLAFLRYYLETWHPLKGMWVACWAYPELREGVFAAHLAAHRRKVLPALAPARSLAACLGELLALQAPPLELPAREAAEAAAPVAEPGPGGVREAEGAGGPGGPFLAGPGPASCGCPVFGSGRRPCRRLFAGRLWAGEPLCDARPLPVGEDG